MVMIQLSLGGGVDTVTIFVYKKTCGDLVMVRFKVTVTPFAVFAIILIHDLCRSVMKLFQVYLNLLMFFFLIRLKH